MFSDIMDTAGEISVLIKLLRKRVILLDKTLRNNLKIVSKSPPNKIAKSSTPRWRVRASALLRIIEDYSYIMELWNGCLLNENLTAETLGSVSTLTQIIFRNHCRAKKCLLPLVNDWQTSLSHCFNNIEPKLPHVEHLIVPLFIALVAVVVMNEVMHIILIHLETTRVVYYEVLDSLITSLKDKFDQPCLKA